MANSYRELLITEGARAFPLAEFVTRMPISMNGPAIVLLVSLTRDSYTLSGAVAAAFTLTAAACGPARAARRPRRAGAGHDPN